MAIQYRIYKNDGAGGAVDYSTVLNTTSSLTYTAAALDLNSDTTFAVRAYDTTTSLDDGGTDARVRIVVDGTGADVTGKPVAPFAVAARPVEGGDVRVSWSYPWKGPDRLPTGFKVYKGTSSVSYASAVATVAYDGGEEFSATLTGLTGGTAYKFAVRAYNAAGEESNTLVVTATSSATAPSDVIDLAGEAI